ncbi:DUF5335 family protein [Streptomyces sp. NPDC047980]|uniref:DUF5335 family protein n=1 Tax=Streptomyces sp. NPDC047980 TaxID=3365494 RepID=UPI0037153763
MTRTSTLERSQWQAALDGVTADHDGKLVSVELLDVSVGHQYEAERMPFANLSYDPKDDVVIVAVGGKSPRYPVVLRHMVAHPKEIDIATEDIPETAVRVVAPDDTATLITFFPAG